MSAVPASFHEREPARAYYLCNSSTVRKVRTMRAADEDLLAFPDTRAAKLAGVSVRRLRYWEERELIVPSIKRSLSPRNTVRLYSYQDLLALLVVATLRTEREMSLQHIRRVVAHLQSRGYAAPLREVKFATLGQEIYFQHPDGSWEGDLEPDQVVLVKTLRLEPLRLRIDAATRRSAADVGRVTTRRGVHASAAVFAGTRVPVATIQDYLRHGYEAQAILEAFPDLDAADVDEAGRLLAAAG
jgi:DNA-binding transcriptional MerR regulator